MTNVGSAAGSSAAAISPRSQELKDAPRAPQETAKPQNGAAGSSEPTNGARTAVFNETSPNGSGPGDSRETSGISTLFGGGGQKTGNINEEDGKPNLDGPLRLFRKAARASAERAPGVSGGPGSAASAESAGVPQPTPETRGELGRAVSDIGVERMTAMSGASSLDDIKKLTTLGDDRSVLQKTALAALDKLFPNFHHTLTEGVKQLAAKTRETGVDFVMNDKQLLLVVQPAVTFTEKGPGGTDIPGALSNKLAPQMNLIWNPTDPKALTVQLLGRQEIFSGVKTGENEPWGGGLIVGDEVGLQFELRSRDDIINPSDLEAQQPGDAEADEDVLASASNNDRTMRQKTGDFFKNLEFGDPAHFKHTHARGEGALPYVGPRQGTAGFEKVAQNRTDLSGDGKVVKMLGLLAKDLAEFAAAAAGTMGARASGAGLGQSNLTGMVAKFAARAVLNELPPYPTNRNAVYNQNHLGPLDTNALGGQATIMKIGDTEINAQFNIYPRIQHSTNSPGYKLGEDGPTPITAALKDITHHEMVLEAAESNLGQFNQGLRDLAVHRDLIQAQLTNNQETEATLETEFENLNQPLEQAKSEISQAVSEFNETNESAAALRRQENAMRQEVVAAQLSQNPNLQELQDQLQAQSDLVNQESAKISEIGTRVQNLQQGLAVLTAENQPRLDELRTTLNELKSQIQGSNDQLTEVTDIEKTLRSLKTHTEEVITKEKDALGKAIDRKLKLEENNPAVTEAAIEENPDLKKKLDARAERRGQIGVERLNGELDSIRNRASHEKSD